MANRTTLRETVLEALLQGPLDGRRFCKHHAITKTTLAATISRLRGEHYSIHCERRVGQPPIYSIVEPEPDSPVLARTNLFECRFCHELIGEGKKHNPTCATRRGAEA